MTAEERVCEILARCRESTERGETVDTDAIVRENPEIAGTLRERFDALAVLDRAYPAPREVSEDSSSGEDAAGTRLGPYRLLEAIGTGGMGSVWRAVVEETVQGLEPGQPVALKLLHSHLFQARGFLDRFLREAEVGRAVVHDNVVRTLHADTARVDDRDHHFVVMEYVEGQSLRDLLRELEKVPEELCRHIGREVARGLAAVHAAGIVHRDVKPENVLITKDHVVKVMDLGVARFTEEAVRLSQTGSFIGSIQYAAPEQFAADRADVDARTDLHGLGLVLYELASGVHPYLADDWPRIVKKVLHEQPRRLGDVDPQISPFFEEVVHCLLEKHREKRFASAREVAELLDVGEEHAWWKERAKALRIATRRPLRRIRIPRETAVYGRGAEIARLHRLFEKAKAGEGQVVLIEGEAGIGKSRLVDELVARLQQEGEDLNFLHGSYPPGGAATASGAFSTAYREQFGEAGSASYLTRTPLLVPAFDALLNGDATPSGAEPLTKDSLQSCFVHATRALAAERTTVVLVDDLHFSPEEGLALFTSLALAAPGHRILLVGTTRPGLSETWQSSVTRLEHCSPMELARLGPKDLVRLLEDAFHSQVLASSLSAQIALKSDGNPFFVFEIIRGLREGQFIVEREDGSWVTTGAIGEIKIPSSVLDLVNARVASLNEAERDVVDVACCLGFEFDPLLVGDVVGLGRIPLLKRLSHIERRHRIVRSAGQRFVFDHHQVQEALYQGLPELLRQEYHCALATALETREKAAEADPAALSGATCVDLCEHFLRGAKGPRALRYLGAAMTRLEAGHMNAAAAALAERALIVPGLVTGADRARLLLRLADRLDFLGRRERQISACREGEDIARFTGDDPLRARAAQALGVAFSKIAESPAAQSAFTRALEIAVRLGDKQLEARLTGNLGAAQLLDVGCHSAAQEHLRRCLVLAGAIGDRRGQATAIGNLGSLFRALGRFAEAREHQARSLALATEIGDRQAAATAMGNLGNVLTCLGRIAEAREHYDRHLAISREIGDRRGEAIAMGNLGHALQLLGRLGEAREHFERNLVLSREIGDRMGVEYATGSLGGVCHSLGCLADAHRHLQRGAALARESGHRRVEVNAAANLGANFQILGRFAEARDNYDRSLALMREVGERDIEGDVIRCIGDLAAEEGDAAAAERGLEESLALHRASGARYGEAETLRARGALIGRLGRFEEARTALAGALAIARALSLHGVALLATSELARLPGGDAAAALAALAAHENHVEPRLAMEARFLLWQATRDRAHLAEAKRRLDFLVEHAPADCRESMLANVRLHREIAAAAKEQRL